VLFDRLIANLDDFAIDNFEQVTGLAHMPSVPFFGGERELPAAQVNVVAADHPHQSSAPVCQMRVSD